MGAMSGTRKFGRLIILGGGAIALVAAAGGAFLAFHGRAERIRAASHQKMVAVLADLERR